MTPMSAMHCADGPVVGPCPPLPPRVEPFAAHPNEVQVWAIRLKRPYRHWQLWRPSHRRAWAGYGLSQGIRAATRGRYCGWYSHLAFRWGQTLLEATERGVVPTLASAYAGYQYHVDAYVVRADAAQHKAACERARLLADKRTPYDFGQLAEIELELLTGWHVPLGRGTKAIICSELIPLCYSPSAVISSLPEQLNVSVGLGRTLFGMYAELGSAVVGEGPDLCLGLRTPLWQFVPDHIALAWGCVGEPLAEYRGVVDFG